MRNIVIILFLLSFGAVITACDSKPKAKAPVAVKIPETPAATVTMVLKGMADNRPDVAWSALPKSYQNDVNKVVAKWASITDKEIYNSYMGLVKRFSVALKQKREIILNTVMKMAPPEKRKNLGSYIDAVIAVMDEITSSQVMNHEQMLKADVGRFISMHGGTLMKSFMIFNAAAKKSMDRMTSIKVVEVSRSGDKAKLDIVKDGKPQGIPKTFVKIEGRWIPSEMQGVWSKQVANANSNLDKAKGKSTEINEKLKKTLPLIESFVKGFEAVENEAQLASFPMRVMLLGQQLKSLMR